MDGTVETLTAAAKRQITADWAARFPSLGIYKPLWLLRRVGPLLEGIVLDRDRSNATYLPTFHVHNLIRSFSDVSLTLMHRLATERNQVDDRIPVAAHARRCQEAADRLSRQITLPLAGDLSVDQVLAAYERQSTLPIARYDVSLYEDPVEICGWAGQVARASALLERGVKVIESWPSDVQAHPSIGGAAKWRAAVESRIKDSFVARAEADEMARALRADGLPQAKLIG